MVKSGLDRIYPHTTDYSLVHTFGATVADLQGMPKTLSIYDGRPLADQNALDTRFAPPLPPLPMGCVAETITLDGGIKTGKLYNPQEFYLAIPPGIDGAGRDIRAGLQTAIDTGLHATDGSVDKELAYFNCYGVNSIDDFDAARFALYLNSLQDQKSKRGVVVGTWFYPEFIFPTFGSGGDNLHPDNLGFVPTPASFNTGAASLHCWLASGFQSTYKGDYLEGITHQGQRLEYFSREIFNALMAQPYTGAFTVAATQGNTPIPIGVQAQIDHLVYYVRNLFHL